MKRLISTLVTLICIALVNVGGCNAYTELYDHETDEAIAVDVQKHIDAGLYSDAIAKWYTMTGVGQTKRANQVLLANAYAGRGGLNLINLFQSLSGGAGNLFSILLTAFRGSTYSNYGDQVMAQNIMLGISTTAANRTTDENVFLLFVEFAKLGTLMASLGDVNADGTVDAAWDNCSVASSDGDEVITAVGNIVDILSVIGTALTGGSLTALQNACASLAGACAVTTTAGVTPVMNQAGRTLLGESNLGIGLAAPYNDPYCQLSAAPIVPHNCPGNTGAALSFVCP